jgi:hypothetical protein
LRQRRPFPNGSFCDFRVSFAPLLPTEIESDLAGADASFDRGMRLLDRLQAETASRSLLDSRDLEA